MEQITMEQIMKFLKAESMARREADKAYKAELMAKMDAMQATMDFRLEEMRAWRTGMKACRKATEASEGKTEVFLEKTEPAPEEDRGRGEAPGSPRESDGRGGDRSHRGPI
jgi:hypothetical protein